MAYPAPFHRIVMIGSLYSDIFNVTMSMVPSLGNPVPASSDELAEAVGTFVGNWWNDPLNVAPPHGPGMIQSAILTSVKVNRIGTDGKYVDAQTFEHVLPEALPGNSVNTPPPQLSVAATWRGSNPRGLAGKGRAYFPPAHFCGTMGADGRISVIQATQYGEAMARLVAGLNDVYITEGVPCVAGIASNTRSGAFQPIVDVTIGRTVDTIRSRRNKIPEDFVVTSF